MAEGGVVGAGSIAGYEAMQRGGYGDDASPAATDHPEYGAGQASPDAPPPTPPSQGESTQGEGIWGQNADPWTDSSSSDSGAGIGEGGEGEGGSSFWEFLRSFWED